MRGKERKRDKNLTSAAVAEVVPPLAAAALFALPASLSALPADSLLLAHDSRFSSMAQASFISTAYRCCKLRSSRCATVSLKRPRLRA